MLVVDAAQGIEAQTLANCYLALEHDLEIVAALNKIDLPAAEPDRYADEIEKVLGIPASTILRMSAKTGEGVPDLLDAVIERIPPPSGDRDAPLQALIFDSHFDQYRGVISSVRVDERHASRPVSAALPAGERRSTTPTRSACARPCRLRSRCSSPARSAISSPASRTSARRARARPSPRRAVLAPPLAGYQDPKPMVFCGLYPVDGDDFADLRESLEKLRLNDASFTYEPETSGALGFGFRCGFLGLLHMEIVRERLEREFDLSLIATAPSVEYRCTRSTAAWSRSTTRARCRRPPRSTSIEEPILRVTILSPSTYTGTLMELCQTRRGEMVKLEYLSPERVELVYRIPLAEVVVDLFDQLKSRTQGYASLDYEPAGYEQANLVKVDVLLNAVPVDAFSTIVHRDKAYEYGRRMSEKLRELIPRQMFDVPIQAAIGGRIIARETVKAKRKDVLAKCYGGDITRKRKLLEKQKEGKKRMKNIGRVEVPQEAFISALRLEE